MEDVTPAVAQWLLSVPAEQRALAVKLRTLIHDVAREHDAWPLVEEIKWGQPSYRSPHGNESTPIRLGWTADGDVALLAHCQSSVIPEFRDAFGDRFRFDGNRAVLFGSEADLPEDEISELISHALTYRR